LHGYSAPSPLPREREQAVLAPFSPGRRVGEGFDPLREEGKGFTQGVYSSSNPEVAVFSIYQIISD